MRYEVTIKSVEPIIHHSGYAGLDTGSPAKREIAEIAKKRGSNRTEPNQTPSVSPSSSARPRSGSTRTERLKSLSAPSEPVSRTPPES